MGKQLFRERAKIAKALAHEARLEIINILHNEGPRCVGELTELLELSQPAVSKHLSLLKEADIISSQKDGMNVIYKLEVLCTVNFFDCIDEILLDRIERRKNMFNN
jgi:ArsR family transcriptional regulator